MNGVGQAHLIVVISLDRLTSPPARIFFEATISPLPEHIWGAYMRYCKRRKAQANLRKKKFSKTSFALVRPVTPRQEAVFHRCVANGMRIEQMIEMGNRETHFFSYASAPMITP